MPTQPKKMPSAQVVEHGTCRRRPGCPRPCCGGREWRLHLDQPVQQREHHRAERQEIDPPAAPGEKRLLQFQAKHAADLAHPKRFIPCLPRRRSGIDRRSSRRHRPAPPIPPPGRIRARCGSAAGRSCRRRVVRSSRPLAVGVDLGFHHVVLLEQARRPAWLGRSQRTRICMGWSFTSLRTPWIWPSATT